MEAERSMATTTSSPCFEFRQDFSDGKVIKGLSTGGSRFSLFNDNESYDEGCQIAFSVHKTCDPPNITVNLRSSSLVHALSPFGLHGNCAVDVLPIIQNFATIDKMFRQMNENQMQSPGGHPESLLAELHLFVMEFLLDAAMFSELEEDQPGSIPAPVWARMQSRKAIMDVNDLELALDTAEVGAEGVPSSARPDLTSAGDDYHKQPDTAVTNSNDIDNSSWVDQNESASQTIATTIDIPHSVLHGCRWGHYGDALNLQLGSIAGTTALRLQRGQRTPTLFPRSHQYPWPVASMDRICQNAAEAALQWNQWNQKKHAPCSPEISDYIFQISEHEHRHIENRRQMVSNLRKYFHESFTTLEHSRTNYLPLHGSKTNKLSRLQMPPDPRSTWKSGLRVIRGLLQGRLPQTVEQVIHCVMTAHALRTEVKSYKFTTEEFMQDLSRWRDILPRPDILLFEQVVDVLFEFHLRPEKSAYLSDNLFHFQEVFQNLLSLSDIDKIDFNNPDGIRLSAINTHHAQRAAKFNGTQSDPYLNSSVNDTAHHSIRYKGGWNAHDFKVIILTATVVFCLIIAAMLYLNDPLGHNKARLMYQKLCCDGSELSDIHKRSCILIACYLGMSIQEIESIPFSDGLNKSILRPCCLCGERGTKSNAKRHQDKHKKEKRYCCHSCHRVFSRADNCEVHERNCTTNRGQPDLTESSSSHSPSSSGKEYFSNFNHLGGNQLRPLQRDIFSLGMSSLSAAPSGSNQHANWPTVAGSNISSSTDWLGDFTLSDIGTFDQWHLDINDPLLNSNSLECSDTTGTQFSDPHSTEIYSSIMARGSGSATTTLTFAEQVPTTAPQVSIEMGSFGTAHIEPFNFFADGQQSSASHQQQSRMPQPDIYGYSSILASGTQSLLDLKELYSSFGEIMAFPRPELKRKAASSSSGSFDDSNKRIKTPFNQDL